MASVIKIIATKEETTDPVELKDVVKELMDNGNKWIALEEEDIAKAASKVTQLSDTKTGLVTEINAVLTGNTKSIDELKKVAEECKNEDATNTTDHAKLNTLFCIIKDLFITKNTKRKYWVEAFLENIKTRIADISTDIQNTKKPYVNAKMGIGKMQAFANSEERDNQKKRLFEYNIKKGKKVAMRKKLRQMIKMLEKLPNSILKNQDNDILKILVQHLEKDEDKKFKLRDTINLRNKKFDPTSLINNYGKFEDANITIEIDNKNPIMSRLREISSEKGLRELYICYGDDKETGCWIYPPKRFESFQDIIKRGEKIEIKVSFPSNEKKKNLYKNVMIDKAKKKGIDIKDMYKINYTNINKEAISPKKIKGKNGAKEDKNADPIFILHPKHLKIVKLDCLYSDGIAVGETVRLYLFDKYDEFNDERHGDVARLMIEEPKTKQITIAEVKTNLTYIIENNIMLPNKPEILFNYKELALKQNNTEIVDSMKGLKNVYNYSCMYAIRNSYNLNYIMFKKEPKEWDDFYNTCKIKSKDETDQTKIGDIFLFVVNGKGSNQSLRINEKYGTLFFNFSSIDKAADDTEEPVADDTYTIIDTNIKNINKVLMEKFKVHWDNLYTQEDSIIDSSKNKIFRLKFDGNETDVFILTINKLQELIDKNIGEEKEKEEYEVKKQVLDMKGEDEKKNNTAEEIKKTVAAKDNPLNVKKNKYRGEINDLIEILNFWNQKERDTRQFDLHKKWLKIFAEETNRKSNKMMDNMYEIVYIDDEEKEKRGKIKISDGALPQSQGGVGRGFYKANADRKKTTADDKWETEKYPIATDIGGKKESVNIAVEKIKVKKWWGVWSTATENFLNIPFNIIKEHIEKFKKFAKNREPLNIMDDDITGIAVFEKWITPKGRGIFVRNKYYGKLRTFGKILSYPTGLVNWERDDKRQSTEKSFEFFIRNAVKKKYISSMWNHFETLNESKSEQKKKYIEKVNNDGVALLTIIPANVTAEGDVGANNAHVSTSRTSHTN